MTGLPLPAEMAAALRAHGAGEGWVLRDGTDPAAAAPRERRVVLARGDPRWSLRDPLLRDPAGLPPGAPVAVPAALGERLLLRVRPDLRTVRAGAFPLAEEIPLLVPGPRDAREGGTPLDPETFVPPPGAATPVLLPPEGVPVPPGIRALEDDGSRRCREIEEAFLEGLGPLPAGAAVGAWARRKVSVLFRLRAVLFPAEGEPRDLAADIPQEGARQFARGFGRHLAS